MDFGRNLTGFIGAKVTCRSKTRLFLTFDEILSKDDVDFKRLGCVNIIAYELQPGTYELESFEPYTLRYLKLIVLAGRLRGAEPLSPRIRRRRASGRPQFAASDERLNRLFAAGRETFRQNALDIFMDCPSRERAGWLCDSFFTCARRQGPLRRHPHREELLRELPPARRSSPTCPTACCPCATPPTTTTACSSRTGRSGSWSSWRNTWRAAATARWSMPCGPAC